MTAVSMGNATENVCRGLSLLSVSAQLLGLNSSATTLSLSSYQVLRLDTAEETGSCLFCSGGDHFIFLLVFFPSLTR